MYRLELIWTIIILIHCQYSLQNQADYNRWRLVRITTVDSFQTFERFLAKIEGNPNFKFVDARKGQVDIGVNPVIKPEELEELLTKFHFSHQILHPDIGRLLHTNERRQKRSVNSEDVFNSYMNLDQMESYFSYLEAIYPRIIKKEVVGTSYEGRNIYMFTISNISSTLDCKRQNHNEQEDLVNMNKLGRLGKSAPYFGNFASGRRLKTKEIPFSVLERAKIPNNGSHKFIYFDMHSLSENVSSTHPLEKPVIFLDGGTHSREWVTPAAALYLIKHLAENPKLFERIDWKIIPMANPDGYVYSWDSDRFWRKTRSITNFPGCFGADINRNFGHHWGEVDTSNFPCYEHYGGPFEFSELETEAIRNEMLKEKRRIKAYISIHNWGQEIVYPYSYSKERKTFTDDELKRVGDGMVKSISNSQNIVYKSGKASIVLYPASGTGVDWAIDVLGIPLVYLFELRDHDGILGFSIPESMIKPTSEDLVAAMTYLAAVVERNTTSACFLHT